jgi:hypothetical protein
MFALSPYDLIWSVAALLVLALTFAALFVWFRTHWDRSWDALLALLVIVVLPVVGPAAFLASRGRRPARGSSVRPTAD